MITGKDLLDIGYPEGKVIGLALQAVPQLKHDPVTDLPLEYFRKVQESPRRYVVHTVLGPVAREFLRVQEEAKSESMVENLRDSPAKYTVIGMELIDKQTLDQMDDAMRLPVSVWGALMPDAHLGYGLPVGGVLATDNEVIPWAVGVDIGCRMHMSVFPASSQVLGQRRTELTDILLRSTGFGVGGSFKGDQRVEHPILDDPRWGATPFLRGLKDVAYRQLGTSGSGNHFVEWGSLDPIDQDFAALELQQSRPRKQLAILSHSGSRGVGFKIANRYAKIAENKLPHIGKLAWLSLMSEEGAEYWMSMELAGDFARANHEVIHKKMAKGLGQEAAAVVENHHNYAWKERIGEKDLIVHRKGATPSHTGELGIIPGTMVDPGYVVTGRGAMEFLNSSSHGAGRTMSRTRARQTINEREWRDLLHGRNIKLIGGDLDEAPGAYKRIDEVVDLQTALVMPVAKFTPSIVRMDDGKRGRR